MEDIRNDPEMQALVARMMDGNGVDKFMNKMGIVVKDTAIDVLSTVQQQVKDVQVNVEKIQDAVTAQTEGANERLPTTFATDINTARLALLNGDSSVTVKKSMVKIGEKKQCIMVLLWTNDTVPVDGVVDDVALGPYIALLIVELIKIREAYKAAEGKRFFKPKVTALKKVNKMKKKKREITDDGELYKLVDVFKTDIEEGKNFRNEWTQGKGKNSHKFFKDEIDEKLVGENVDHSQFWYKVTKSYTKTADSFDDIFKMPEALKKCREICTKIFEAIRAWFKIKMEEGNEILAAHLEKLYEENENDEDMLEDDRKFLKEHVRGKETFTFEDQALSELTVIGHACKRHTTSEAIGHIKRYAVPKKSFEAETINTESCIDQMLAMLWCSNDIAETVRIMSEAMGISERFQDAMGKTAEVMFEMDTDVVENFKASVQEKVKDVVTDIAVKQIENCRNAAVTRTKKRAAKDIAADTEPGTPESDSESPSKKKRN